MRYETFVSQRYLPFLGRKRGISVIAWISLLGVTIGVMVLLVVISVMNGFEDDLTSKVIGHQSHVILESMSLPTQIPFQDLHAEMEKIPHVVGSSPVILGQALLRSDRYGFGAQIKGVDVRYEKDVTAIEKDVEAGAGSLDPLRREMEKAESVVEATTSVSPSELFKDPERTPGIVLGKELAKKLFGYSGVPREMEQQVLNMLIGREIRVISPVEERGPRGTRMRQNVFRIVAITESGLFDYDDIFAFISLRQAQYLYDISQRFTRIEVRLDDPRKANGVAALIADRLASKTFRHYEPRVWMEFNRPLFAALEMERIAMQIILAMIILVAGFSVMATLIMTVLQKRREIGVLRAIGATEKGIRRIFLRCGALVGGVGAFVGCSLGFLICFILEFYKIDLPGGGQVYYIDKMPVQMRLQDFAFVAAVTVVTCVVAAIYPAWLAAKLVPVEALRYE